jgi:uncharacterized protein (DUF305 family)
MKIAGLVAVAIAFLALGQAVSAQSMQGMDMAPPSGDEAVSSKAYRSAMSKMEKSMAVTLSGDPDRDDFVAGMIPHHEGAVAMAKTELQYGKDPQLRKLAREVIAAQTKEIAFMQSWQAKHAK